MYYFGPLAAQSDPDILSYFYQTKQVVNLLSAKETNNNFIYIARPGGGKSALVKWFEQGKHTFPIIAIKSEEVRMVIAGDQSATTEDHRILMTAELYAGLILQINRNVALSSKLKVACEQYIAKSWLESANEFFKTRFQAVNIVGTGFTLKPQDRQAYIREIVQDKKIENASDLLRRIAESKSIIVTIDNPEYIVGQGLEDVTKENAIRIGAFLSVLHELSSLKIKVVVFVKEHIIQSVRKDYRDFSHYSDCIESLEWTSDDLVNLLNLRIKNRLQSKWDAVIDFDVEVLKEEVLPYLVNGPRDLLNIFNIAGKSDGKISIKEIQKGITGLRRVKWEDIQTQYHSQWPSIDKFAKTIITMLATKFGASLITKKDFVAAIKTEYESPKSALNNLRKQEAWINVVMWASTSIEEILFIVGCVGYIHEKKKVYSWSGGSLEKFRLADKLFISPLFL